MGEYADNSSAIGSCPARAVFQKRHVFKPFRVQRYEPLIDAVRQRRIKVAEPILLLEASPKPIALLTKQLAYHHVAQGDLEGHRWMVSF